MSTYNVNLTLENIRTITIMFLDIFIIWLILYYALRIIRNNARTIQIFKGIMVIIVIDGLAKILGLKTVQYLADMFINWGLLAIIIIFQPEIRSLLEKMGIPYDPKRKYLGLNGKDLGRPQHPSCIKSV